MSPEVVIVGDCGATCTPGRRAAWARSHAAMPNKGKKKASSDSSGEVMKTLCIFNIAKRMERFYDWTCFFNFEILFEGAGCFG